MGTIQADPSGVSSAQEWPLARVLTFRFFFVYFLLFVPPAVSWLLPGGSVIDRGYNSLAYPPVAWIASHVFGSSPPIRISHGSDTIYNFVEKLLLVLVAATVTGIWSLVSSKRSHPSLHAWTRVALRYAVALNMLSYGYGKVLRIQFPLPQLDRLLEPYGQTMPMGLLWTFMAYSPGYNIFTGAIEVIGAVLLFWERTTAFGALILVAALTNVVALNLAYDVPIRLYAMHLLIAAVALAVPHLSRLAKTLTSASMSPLPLKSRAFAVAKVAAIALVIWAPTVQFRGLSASLPTPTSPRYGIWEVDEFFESDESRPLQFGDPTVWRRLIVTEDGSVSVQTGDDAVVQWRSVDRVADQTFELTGTRYPRDQRRRASLRYEEYAANRLVVEGTYDGRPVRVMLHRVKAPQFELLSHAFHWINESQHNR